ncbi:hypothetical protein [Tabrizicola thermarum]|uniref:hypothetical protein n=1 Tax=Tabrizicola thermarum TaxID=2670345 RepID=UPI000FFBADA6|nr:hypothetical protein [Tabrizicola thermarum]
MHALRAVLGAAEANQSVVIDPGKVSDLDLILGTGLAVVEATYSDSVKVEGGDQYVEIFEARKDIDGNRNSVAYAYGAGARFDLTAGDYVAVVTLGAARSEVPFTIKVGERTDITVPLNAGVAAFTSPGDGLIEVLAAKADINGNRASLAYGYGPAWQTTLPAGDYIVKLTKADKSSETPLTVTAGERSELALTLP